MNIVEQPVEVDGEKLMQFVFRAVDEVGATLNAALVVMGDKLGLYRALAGTGGLSPAELAERTGTAERYVREWLNPQAAGGFVEYDPDTGRYGLAPEQTVALTDESSPAYLHLQILNQDGATKLGRLLGWYDSSLAPGADVVYTVSLASTTTNNGKALIAAVALSLTTPDPNYKNNFAADVVTLTAPAGARASGLVAPARYTTAAVLLARLRTAGPVLKARAY